MKLSKKQIDLKECLNKEWVLSNGIGGFCSTTVIGLNTRRYHGLLVAPLMPPAQRHLIFSKLDESIEIEGEKFNLYTNISNNYISEGYKYLDSFKKEYLPEYTYKVKDIKIVKTISMIYGRNTVVVQYKIKSTKNNAKFCLTPIVNFRDFHHMRTNHIFNVRQKISNTKVRLEIDEHARTPIYMYSSEGTYIEHYNDIFYNMHYIHK